MTNETTKRFFPIPATWLTDSVKVDVVGCGGTGSQVLTGLAQLDHALREMDHPGLQVTVWDDDKVEPFNVGRQPFYPADVGHHKATVLINRINLAYGVAWQAVPQRFTRDAFRDNAGLVIGCVDTKASRREIDAALRDCYRWNLWLDMGNMAETGQVVLGSINRYCAPGVVEGNRLPVVTDLFPEILDESIPEPDDVPSCSMRDALRKQSLFINREMANQGLALLWDLFSKGRIERHGVFVNLAEGRTNPMPVDPAFWTRMGITVNAAKTEAQEAA